MAPEEPAYQTVEHGVREVSTRAKVGQLKASAKVAFVTLGVGCFLGVAWVRHRGFSGPARAPPSDVTFDFQVKSVPGDCKDLMRYEGCQKKAWLCDTPDDTSNEYRCCCDMSFWEVPWQYQNHGNDGGGSNRPVAASAMATHGGASMLRLQKAANLCLAGPEELGSHFTLASCTGDSNTRFKLPPRGAGSIQLADQPGQCLGVVQGSLKHVKAMPCSPGSIDQQFQLTNGDKGMLQWSHGGNKCLDSENGSPESGSKIALADCVYWPLKPSQTFVLEDAPKKVPKAEKAKAEEKDEEKHEVSLPHPSLYCTSLMLPWSYEVDMLRSHLAKKVGIFACTGWAVYSNEKVRLKEGPTPDDDVYCNVIEGSLKAKIGGKFHTALNTPVFQRFWKKLIDDKTAFDYDWTLKVDPDCVFFPDRLTDMLKTQYGPRGTQEKPVWLNNCQLGLHGPLEVFNKAAFHIFADAGDHACDDVAEEHGQEDVFLRHCFMKLGVPKQDAFNLLLESEWACNERPSSASLLMPPCFDRQVSFHPFKSVESYFKCYDKAAKMNWNSPLYMNSQPPSTANHHSA